MPEPRKKETKKSFIKRCVPQLIKEGKKPNQATAICHSIWDDKKNKNEEELMDYFRADIARGIKKGKWGVDRENEIIKGFAVVTKGVTHDRRGEFDDRELKKLVEMGNDNGLGLKSRFGHPNMSATALGTFLGRIKNFYKDKDVVRADLYIDKTAHKTPNGDLADYVMNLAERDPDAFGYSMVINWNPEYRVDKDGKEELDEQGNPLPPFIRVDRFRAVDIVDDPAANNSMFEASFFGDTNVKFSAEMTAFLDKFLDNPDAVEEGISFLKKYSHNRDYKEREKGDKKEDEKLKQGDKKEVVVVMDKIFTQEEFDNALVEKTKELQGSLSEKDTKIVEVEGKLSEKDELIKEKDNLLTEKDSVILEKENKLSEQETAISEKDGIIESKDSELSEKNDSIKKFEAEKKVDSKWDKLSVDYNEEDAAEIKSILLKAELGETLSTQEAETLLEKKVGSSLPAKTVLIDSNLSDDKKEELCRLAGIKRKEKK